MKQLFSSLFGLSDEQAMWRVQMHDDTEAFAQLLRRWEGPIQRLCARMTGDSHKGEDLAQETFAKLYAKRKDIELTGKFSTFLWRMAVNLCYDELRKRKRRPETSLNIEDDEDQGTLLSHHASAEATPAESMLQEEAAARVRSALDRLPEHYRAVIVMRHYENLKFCEIAAALEIPEGTAKSRMAHGLAQLHRMLGRDLDQPHSRKRETLML